MLSNESDQLLKGGNMSARFDVLDPTHMTGEISLRVLDHDLDVNMVLQDDLQFNLEVKWCLTGLTQNGQQDIKALGGEWTVRAFAESIGGGFEGQIGTTQTIPLSTQPAVNPRCYQSNIPIAPFTLRPGAYELIVLVNYSNLNVPLRMAGFVEGHIVQIYHFDKS